MTRPSLSQMRAWTALAVSLLLLNASLTFENVWPTPKVRWGSALSIELAACVLLLAVAYRTAGRMAERLLPALWVLLVAGHYLDVTAPGLYGRDFNLYWDSQHLGNVAAMLARAAPWWLIATVMGGAALAIWIAFAVSRLAFRSLAAAVARPGLRAGLAATAVAVFVLFGVQQMRDEDRRPVTFADPVSPAYVRQVRYVTAMLGPGATAPRLGTSPAFDSQLRGLDGADVILVFLESYGAITYDSPEMAAALAESRAVLAAAAGDTGRHVASAYVDSPTFGGSSWLAHLSLITGVEVRDQYAYSSLMASNRPTIFTNFKRRGYRAVALMPGMRQPWPEGAFYQFDTIYGRDALEYRGPEFGWWSIPDQYALARLDALERHDGPRAPVVVFFPTSTTHAPFGPVAPYQEDWTRVLTEHPFDEADVSRSFAAQPDLTNLAPSYVKAMAYDFVTLAGYIRHQAADPVIVVIGDHQPPAAVSGKDAPWQVPVHVITGRSHLFDRLVDHGFQEGLHPSRPSLGPMHTLVPTLLDVFDTIDPADTPGPHFLTMSGTRPTSRR